jgi:hypothetical protein
VDTAYFENKFNTLTPEFIGDLLDYIEGKKGKLKKKGNQWSGKLSLAFAFADLYLSDPEDVTDSHIRLLEKEFSPRQISDLIRLLKEVAGKKV